MTSTLKLAKSDVTVPVNVGSSELVTINEMVDLVADIAGIDVTRRHTTSTRRKASEDATVTTR